MLDLRKRQPKNLKQMLTRAQFTNTNGDPSPKVTKCNDKRCGTCPHIIEGNEFTFENGQKFKVKCNMDCSSKNVIYAIKCTKCNKSYIGQTTYLRGRVRVHKQQINDSNLRHLEVSKHIAQCGNGDFQVYPFYKIHENADSNLDAKERFFISKYCPSLNKQ